MTGLCDSFRRLISRVPVDDFLYSMLIRASRCILFLVECLKPQKLVGRNYFFLVSFIKIHLAERLIQMVIDDGRLVLASGQWGVCALCSQ